MLTESFKNQANENCHQILERSLNNKFNPRPPKLHISGVLTPISSFMNGKALRFKIVSDSAEVFLNLSPELSQVAKKIAWEEVTARGTFDFESNIFNVERLSLKNSPGDMPVGFHFSDNHFDLEYYTQTISRSGRIELEPGYLAS